MCTYKQTGGSSEDEFICSKCNSSQAKENPTVAVDDEGSSLLHATFVPNSPTISSQHVQFCPQLENIIVQTPTPPSSPPTPTTHEDLFYYSHLSPYLREAKAIGDVALPMILTGLLLYLRSMISMLFLGRLGELALAGGSLAVGFANITGYSVLSGLAMGMEPICGQAFGAHKHSLLGLTLYRTILLLLLTCLPISFLWLNMHRLLLLCGQDLSIATQAQAYLLYSLPDLLAQSILHPIRIYLRSQSITLPLTISATLSIALHLPLNWLVVMKLKLGIKGVALASVCTNLAMLGFLLIYILLSKPCRKGLVGGTLTREECLKRVGLTRLIKLAIASCISVCLEWWWYEIMILLCGLLHNPSATVASMGILIQTTSLIYIFPSSLNISLSTRVGNEIGAGQPKRARRAAMTGLFFSFIMGFSALVFTLIMRDKWAKMFTADPEIIRLTTLVLPIIGLCELGNCPQTTGCGVLRGTARPKVGANINLGCFYLVGMPVAVWLGFYSGFGFEGLWVGLMAAQGSCVVTMMLVLSRTDWEFEAKRAKELTDHNYPSLLEVQGKKQIASYNQPLLV